MCIHCCEQLGFGVLDKIDHLASINIQQLLKLGDGVNELQLKAIIIFCSNFENFARMIFVGAQGPQLQFKADVGSTGACTL